jgi:TIR domain
VKQLTDIGDSVCFNDRDKTRERTAMAAYLSDYEHDIFVSYAHSELNDWSKRLVEDTRKFVATGLGLRQAKQVDLWMDYKICGNQPLTGQLRDKVARSGVLLVLMSEWYLESSWCRDEVEWFSNTVRQKRAGRPIFVVRVRATDHAVWPKLFKDERGHALTGYDFVRDSEDNGLGLPKGYPRPEDAPDSKGYYDAVSKLASDIVAHLKTLAPASPPRPEPLPDGASGPRGDAVHRDRVFLAAAPAEDVDDLRDELAGMLRAKGCIVLPETNPVDLDEVHERAADWISSADKFVQVLGGMSGSWRHDNAGFVMYQHELAKKHDKPIFVYRAPLLDTSQVKKREYREFIERFDQDEVGELRSFADQVMRVAKPRPVRGARRSVFMMASARDESLEREIRRLLGELKISVYPLARCGPSGREVAAVLDENSSFLNLVRRCGAILLINGSVKEEDRLWVDDRVADIEFDIQEKLGGHLPYAIVDGPPAPRLQPREGVFPGDSPTLKHDLQGWLQTLNGRAGTIGGGLS